MFRSVIPTALLLAALPVAAGAQSGPSLWDLIKPERIVRSFAQTGIMALRTQMDVKYGDMDIDLSAGRVSLTDVRIWPLPEWDEDGDCEVSIDRLTIRTAAVDESDRLRFKLQALGTSAPGECFPEEPRGALTMAGLSAVTVPRLTMDIDYDIRSSGLETHLYADIDGVAAADLTAVFSYVWIDGRDDMEEPDPVVFLSSASLTVENKGIWDVLKGQMPPPMTDPASAPMMIDGMLGSALAEMNRDAADSDEGGDPSALTDAQRAFLASIKQAWPAFLQDPQILVLETSFEGDVYLDFEAMEDDPRDVFDALMPRLALAPARTNALISAAMIRGAMGQDSTLPAEDRRAVGLALVTGNGAPRNISAGLKLLRGLADEGDGAAAMALSDALEARSPADAYRWALKAGAAGQAGATARLDRIEDQIGLASALKLQEETSGGDTHPVDALQKIALIREQAAMRLSGRGLARSYGIAAMWSMIGAAAGDAEAADILGDIDDRVRLAAAEGRDAWAVQEETASRLAMEAWLGQDLPARFAR